MKGYKTYIAAAGLIAIGVFGLAGTLLGIDAVALDFQAAFTSIMAGLGLLGIRAKLGREGTE